MECVCLHAMGGEKGGGKYLPNVQHQWLFWWTGVLFRMWTWMYGSGKGLTIQDTGISSENLNGTYGNISPSLVNNQVKGKAAIPVSLELQLKAVQLVIAPISGSGSVQWCVNELMLPHQDLTLVTPRADFLRHNIQLQYCRDSRKLSRGLWGLWFKEWAGKTPPEQK